MTSYTHEVIEETPYLPVFFRLVQFPPTTVPAHWHEYLELLYMIDGHLTAVIQAETYELATGQMLIINSRDLHMTQTFGDSVYILLQISAEQLKQYLPEMESLHFQTLIPAEALSETISTCISSMLDLFQKHPDGYQLLFTARLYELLFQLYTNHTKRISLNSAGIATRDFKRITQTMKWVRCNFQQPLSLDDAAASLNLSREHFCRLFKKYTGQTFLEYVNAVRTMHLYEDLTKTDKSITLLMEENCLTNYKVFMRIFKKLYGNTPQKIRAASRS